MRFKQLFFEKLDQEKLDLYKKWKSLINMSSKEIQEFLDSDDGKVAGLSKKDAEGPIKRGRDSARAIIRMLDISKDEWSDNDWDWAKRQVSFISRMSNSQGPLKDEKGNPTRKLLSLKVWGYDPTKS
jgi:hypothetical protein